MTNKTPKKEKEQEDVELEDASDDEDRRNVSIIANPLANEKLTKRCFKLVKKAAKNKKIKRGVKEVVKAIRKNEKGICILAGNISPIDVISHIPVLCEDSGIPYIYVPSKEKLGASSLTKRPTSCILLPTKLDGDDEYAGKATEVVKSIKDASPTW